MRNPFFQCAQAASQFFRLKCEKRNLLLPCQVASPAVDLLMQFINLEAQFAKVFFRTHIRIAQAIIPG